MTCALLLALLCTTPSMTDFDREKLEHAVAEIMEQHHIPGAVIAIVTPDGKTAVFPYGVQQLEPQVAMSADAVFQVGSVTKPFTATLLGLLAADGVVEPDDPVVIHLPDELELHEGWDEITLRHLATHTSGLPRDPVNRRNRDVGPGVMLPYSVRELLDGLRETELATSPGERWAYSNLGYAVLGHALERAAGSPYAELLQRRILKPLRMKDSSMRPGPELRARLAVCTWPEDSEEWIAREPWQFGEVAAFAGLSATAADLARFVHAQWASPPSAPFPAVVLRDLHEARVDIDPRGQRRMATGWFVDPVPGAGHVLGHGGEVDGHSACLAVLTKHEAGLVVLASRGGNSAEQLIRGVMAVVLPSWIRGG